MYWGYQSAAAFAMWICFAVCFVVGAIWMPIGAAGIAGCKYCKDKFGSQLSVDNPYIEEGCRAAAAAYLVYEPDGLTKSDPVGDWYDACLGSGPIAAVVAGSVVLLASFVFLSVFFCLKPPVHLPKD